MGWMNRFSGGVLVCVAAALIGCEKEPPPPAYKPREAPDFGNTATATQPAASMPAMVADPHGFQGKMTPAHGAMSGPSEKLELELQPPSEWVARPARAMTSAVYALPKAEGDTDDADLAISSLGRPVPFQANVDRWCSFFDLGEGRTCADAAKQRKIEGTKYPTMLVEISGSYKGSSMMGPQGPPKPGYIMLVAEVLRENNPWYFRLVGPERTVNRWREAFIKYVSDAK